MKKIIVSAIFVLASILSTAQYTLTIDDISFENGIIKSHIEYLFLKK